MILHLQKYFVNAMQELKTNSKRRINRIWIVVIISLFLFVSLLASVGNVKKYETWKMTATWRNGKTDIINTSVCEIDSPVIIKDGAPIGCILSCFCGRLVIIETKGNISINTYLPI